MIKTDKIAVVILNWNGRDMMRRFLPSVVKNSQPEGCVIVADNGSTDGSLQMLTEEFPEVLQLPLPQNYGFAEGYNQAFKQIDAPYYLLLNSDVEVPEHWLTPLLAYMEAHPETAACQPKLLSQKEKTMFEYAGGAGGFMDAYGYPFCRGRIFADVEYDQGQYDTIRPLLWATGAALMVRREDWQSSGGLDARFFAHMEEIDLCWRLRARGRGIVCVPQSLPEDELNRVMRVRKALDWVAALKFLLTGDVKNFKAVMKARKEFARMRPDFEKDRKHNLQQAVNGGKNIEGRINRSILWLYYCGNKKFSQLGID